MENDKITLEEEILIDEEEKKGKFGKFNFDFNDPQNLKKFLIIGGVVVSVAVAVGLGVYVYKQKQAANQAGVTTIMDSGVVKEDVPVEEPTPAQQNPVVEVQQNQPEAQPTQNEPQNEGQNEMVQPAQETSQPEAQPAQNEPQNEAQNEMETQPQQPEAQPTQNEAQNEAQMAQTPQQPEVQPTQNEAQNESAQQPQPAQTEAKQPQTQPSNEEVQNQVPAQTVQAVEQSSQKSYDRLRYYIQVESVLKLTSGDKKLIKKIKDAGFDYVISRKYIKKDGKVLLFKRILVGPFESKQEAKEALSVIRERVKKDAFIILTKVK